jgi:D-alanyl-D-alanine carboxypeptidase (penicillin-binding protein 5/6)
MTALVVWEREDPDDVVTIGKEAAEEGSSGPGYSELGLKRGEHLTIRQLLYALLLPSANDAAVALADAVSGTSKRFVRVMNAEVEDLRLTGTYFYSPNGLDDRGYSTPHDLATIGEKVFGFPFLEKILGKKFRDIPAQNAPPRHVQNRNVLLWLYKGALGGKTGYTAAAGYCLLAAAERGGRRLVAVVLGDPSSEASFTDAASLLNYGFHAFVRRTVVGAGATFSALRVARETVPVETHDPLRALFPLEQERGASIKLVAAKDVDRPLRMGERVGWAQATLDGRLLGRTPVFVVGTPETVPSTDADGWVQRSVEFLVRASSDALRALFG